VRAAVILSRISAESFSWDEDTSCIHLGSILGASGLNEIVGSFNGLAVMLDLMDTSLGIWSTGREWTGDNFNFSFLSGLTGGSSQQLLNSGNKSCFPVLLMWLLLPLFTDSSELACSFVADADLSSLPSIGTNELLLTSGSEIMHSSPSLFKTVNVSSVLFF